MLADDPDGISWCFLSALATAKLGRVAAALERFHGLLAPAERLLGRNHTQTRQLHEQIEFWSGR